MRTLLYLLRTAGASMRRSPGLTTLVVAGIALGIAVSTTFLAVYYLLARDPIPHKSDHLYYVQLDNWGTGRPFDDEEPERPPDQVAWIDALALLESDVPTHQSAMYKSELLVYPPGRDRPRHERVRLCTRGFFAMFEPPFRHGGPWSRAADLGPEPQVVLSHRANQRLFGGEDSVGRSLRIGDREFRVVGVLAPWRPLPKYYDPHNDPKEAPEDLYLPLRWAPDLEAATVGNMYGWLMPESREFESVLASELVWLQMWVQLDDAEQVARYRDFVDAYTAEQRALGRYPRPVHDNRLLTVGRWLDQEGVVPDGARNLLVVGLLFLVVCALNLVGVLLGKFLARAPQVSVRRALGASRRHVFLQHVLECELIALLGGLLGLLLTVGGLRLAGRLLGDPEMFHLEPGLLAIGLALALAAGLLAGLYPAWRVCRVQPAFHLKTQ